MCKTVTCFAGLLAGSRTIGVITKVLIYCTQFLCYSPFITL
jgi:hypothetical protein